MYSSSTSEPLPPCALSPDAQLTATASVGVVVGGRADVQAKIASGRFSVMAAITYGLGAPPAVCGAPLNIVVPLDPVSDAMNCELWYSGSAVQHGTLHGVSYAQSNDALFGYITVRQEAEAFEQTVQRAYTRLLVAVDELQCPHLLRVWNYFSAINADEQDTERYQLFCIGRHRAFEAHYRNRMIERLPAASAIGTRDSDLIIYFLAARARGQHLENPRQVSAYCYPKQYGPSSPAFSRATVKQWATVPALYLSGTASVVGHASLHLNDAAGQTRETLKNIRALFAAANTAQQTPWSKSATMLKLYVRDAKDVETVRALAHKEFGNNAPLLMLQGDICRRDLMLEIEGVYSG